MTLTSHLLVRITLVGLLCWLGVSATVVWQLRQEGRQAIDAQADRLKSLTELQLRRQLVAQVNGDRTPDLARVAALFDRPVCLRYQGHDVSYDVSWGCEAGAEQALRAPAWLDQWLERSGALPRQVQRRIELWSRVDGTLTVRPARAAVIEGLWQRLRDLTGLTAATILALNLGVLLALRRLLRPTGQLVRVLAALGEGRLQQAVAARGPREFRRMLEGAEGLRQRLALLTAQRAELTARLINSQEDERRDLARDLHDEMGQCLAALQAVSAGIRISAQAREPARAEDTETLDETIAQMLAGLRALLSRLRPPLLDSQGPALALAELVNGWNARQRLADRGAGAPLRAELQLPAPWPALDEPLGLGLYRATQEALTNAARYASPAQAVRVQVSLQPPEPAAPGGEPAPQLCLQVSNACGPAAGATPARGSGLGLRMMAERVRSLGGTLSSDASVPGRFELAVRWPLHAAAPRPLDLAPAELPA
jgi:signal transduction histidine kinase